MGNKIKLPLKIGLPALCNHISSIKRTAEQSGSAVSALAQATAESMEEIEGILSEKQDVVEPITVTIPTVGWSRDEQQETTPDIEDGVEAVGQPETDYPYWYDIPVEGITDKDRADVIFGYRHIKEASSYGICPVSESGEGFVRIRSVVIPQNDLPAIISVKKGRD